MPLIDLSTSFFFFLALELRALYSHDLNRSPNDLGPTDDFKSYRQESDGSLPRGKAIFIYQARTLTKDSVLWNGLPQSGNIASPTFGEKIRNPLNLSLNLHLSNMSDLMKMHYRICHYFFFCRLVFATSRNLWLATDVSFF
jgi:hypothetical protein